MRTQEQIKNDILKDFYEKHSLAEGPLGFSPGASVIYLFNKIAELEYKIEVLENK